MSDSQCSRTYCKRPSPLYARYTLCAKTKGQILPDACFRCRDPVDLGCVEAEGSGPGRLDHLARIHRPPAGGSRAHAAAALRILEAPRSHGFRAGYRLRHEYGDCAGLIRLAATPATMVPRMLPRLGDILPPA